MPKYYFTFSSSGQVYQGGWVEIYAINVTDAQQKFEKRYGDEARNKETVLLRYSDHYRENLFRASGMIEIGNLGAYCLPRSNLFVGYHQIALQALKEEYHVNQQ